MACGGETRRPPSSRSARRGQRSGGRPGRRPRDHRRRAHIAPVEDEGDVRESRRERGDAAVAAAPDVHLPDVPEGRDALPVAAHREAPHPRVLAQEAEAPRDHAAAPVRPDGDAGASGAGLAPGLRDDAGDRAALPQEAGDPHPCRTSTPASRAASSSAASRARRRTAKPGDPAPVLAPECRSIRRHESHAAQGMGREGANPIRRAHGVQEPPGLGGDALAADLVPREARGVEEEHVVPALREEAGHGRAGRPAAGDDDVASLLDHAPSPDGWNAGRPERSSGSAVRGRAPVKDVLGATRCWRRRPGAGRGTVGDGDAREPGARERGLQLVGAEASPDREEAVLDAHPAAKQEGEGRAAEKVRDERAVKTVHDQRARARREARPGSREDPGRRSGGGRARW